MCDAAVAAFPSFITRNKVDLSEVEKYAEKQEATSLSQSLSMANLLKKLSAVGLSATYVRRAGLPERRFRTHIQTFTAY